MKKLLALMPLLGSCYSVPVAPPADGTLSFCYRPVTLVVSEDFTDECLVAIDQAVMFWRGAGVDYLEMELTHEELDLDDYLPNVIQVVPHDSEGLINDQYLGLTLSYHNSQCTGAANIILATCRLATVAHEIGHALGLPHSDDPKNLMFMYSNDSLTLTTEQREAVQ
jgi:hypothetical protein